MKNYFVGLDIGTNSVGYAVTDEKYSLMKAKGEPMWGSHVFEEASQCDERRSHRTARRRLDRRQQRVHLTQEIFAGEIEKVDPRFFIRLKESALYREDTSGDDRFLMFNDEDFSDKEYYDKYPTIHHLITDLIVNQEPHDVRLVYIAVAWLMAHRGHFLSEVNKDNVSAILDFGSIYKNFLSYFEEYDIPEAWDCESEIVQEVLLTKVGISKKEKLFVEKLFEGKKPKNAEETVISKEGIIKLLSGAKVELGKIFVQKEFEEKTSFSFKMSEEEFEQLLIQTDDDISEFLVRLRALYDWALLYEVTNGELYISKAKVDVYETHKNDLKNLKEFVKKYIPNKYDEVFKNAGETNYVAYSYNLRSVSDTSKCKKASREDFSAYLAKLVKNVAVEECDEPFYQDMMERLDLCTFLPKQVNTDNRVIPYQLYYVELKKILENAKEYLPFLKEKEGDIDNIQKLLSVFTFRIPYYVGPLHKENSDFAWLERKATGKIYPWNFDRKIDLDASETAFISKMTNTCTYLPGETVLAKNSLLYCKFTVLNEINNIKVNQNPISVEAKQGIYHLFEKKRKVKVKDIRDFLISNNYMTQEDELSGVDTDIKSGLKSYCDFRQLLEKEILNENDVERIIDRLTYSEEKGRVMRWLEREYPQIDERDRKYICGLEYKDFGRLSRKFLSGFRGAVKETGEALTIIETLWNTNDNLMEIINSDKYEFKEILEAETQEYYANHPASVNSLLEEMYVSNAVKRPIFRTLAVMKDITKFMGCAPKKIFVEMARGGEKEKKRTKTRRNQIEELYSNFDLQEVRELSKQLEGKTDNELQSEALFLYFMQMGKCMYSGEPIDIGLLKTDKYNVDHIYPQAYVKDDSLNNKVLVLSKINGEKGDIYPINASIRSSMKNMWKAYLDKGLITEAKYKRLTRTTPFSDDEKMEFINRQLVETRQSTKALTAIFKNLYPDTEIVYVKAGLVSDFRQEFKIVKSRLVNDLHHAKDAYLQIVCGNVYSCKFTKKYFLPSNPYSLKTSTIYTHKVKLGDEIVWNGVEDLKRVKEILAKNNIHYTRYSFVRKGGLFDQMPIKASEGLVERKAGLSTEKYGGYNKPTASFFLLTKYTETKKKAKTEVMFMPVDLMATERVLSDENYARQYAIDTIAKIWGLEKENVSDVSFPLGLRALKVNTVISFDGFWACISGKSNEGQNVLLKSLMPVMLSAHEERYIKNIESYINKKKKNVNIVLDSERDGISREQNIKMFDMFVNKLQKPPYSIVFSKLVVIFQNGRERFVVLETEEQIQCLLEMLSIFSTSRTGGCDLTSIGGKKASGVFVYSSKLSNIDKYFHEVFVVDGSASGIYQRKSENLLELL